MPESQLATLFLKQSNDLIWIIDSNFCLKYANQAYQNVMKQVTGEEKKNDESIFTEGFIYGSKEKWKACYERGLNGEQFEIEENFYNPHTNQVEFSEISFKPLTDENQVVVNVACQSRDITSYIKTNTEAEKLLDASLDVICSIDAQGNFIKLNDACKDLWGYEKDELIGKAYIDFVIEEDVEKTNQAAADTIDGKLLTTFENRYKRKDGGIAFNFWSARWDPESQIMFCVARDGREKIKKEELLIESENRFKSLVQEGSDMISIIDAAGTYMYTSPNTTAILGITPEEFDGNTVFDFIHPDDVERAASYMQRITTERKVLVEPFRLRDGNNEWRWIETVLTNMMDNPAIRGYVSNSRDITPKKVEEQRLKLLESVITNTNDAVLITEAEPLDQPGPRIIYVNEAFTKMTGYAAEEVIGKTPRILQGPKSDKVELAKLSKALRNWEPCEITTINYKKNGEEFWINFSVSPVADETGWYTHWIAVERDVTEQKTKELENELVAQISSTFNLVNDFETVTKKLCEIIGLYGKLDWVELWMPNLEMTEIRLTSHYVLTPEDEIFYSHNEDAKFYKDESLIGKVWASEKQLFWDDVTKRKEFKRADSAKKIGLKSVMGIPLIYNNEVLGVLTVGVKSNSGHLKNYARIFERLEKFIGSELQRKNLEIELGRLFDTIPDIISVGDFQGKFLRINKPGCELLRYTEEEILQKGFENFIHPEDLNICYEEIQQLQEGRDTFGFEVRFITKSGEILWLSWYCKAKIKEGLIYCTAKNITEEKKLRELNRQTRKLAKIGSWEVDLVNQSIYWSDEVHQMHETDASSFTPNLEQAVEFYREDFRELVNQSIEKSITNGEAFDFEAVLVTAKKKELWVRAIGNAEFVDGKCTSIYGSFQDINESKETEHRLQSLSNNLPGVVFQYVLYPDGTDRLLYVSDGAELIWGFSAEEAMQNNQQIWKQIEKGGDLEAHKKSIEVSIATKSLWKNKYRYVMPNNEIRTHLGYGSPKFLADGTIVFHSMIIDISKEVKNEELLDEVSKIAKIGTWETDLVHGDHFKSPMIDEILELEAHQSIPDMESTIEFCRPDYRDKMKALFMACISQGTSFDFEAVIVTAKKKEKWVRIIGSPKMHDGNCLKIIGSLQDINSLKETETRLKAISNNLPGVVYQYLIFPDGTDELRYVSGAVEQLWGFTPAQVLDNINIVWDQIKAGGRFEETQISIAKSIETKSKWTNTIKYMMPNGELRTHLGNGMPSFLADGTIVFNSIVLDITQEAKNEQMLEQTTTIAKIGSWEMSLTNQNRENMYWSPIVFEILELDSTYDPSFSGGLGLIIDDSHARIKRVMDALINEGKEYDEEVQLRTGKGATKWVRLIGKCELVNNQIIKIYGSIQDINEKKIAEEQLVSLLNERNNILESIGDAFFAVENDWVVTYWNQRAESVLGIKKEDIVGKSFWEVFADAIDTDFYTKYHYAKENMEIQNFEAFYETSNQWFEVTAYPSEDGLSVYFKDITERKIANAEIVKSEEKRRLIMNGALDAIVSIDTNETITFWNPQADVIFGWKAEEVMGKPLSEVIIPEAFRKNHVEGLKNYLKTGEGKALNVLLELSAIRKNGEEFPIELTVIPIKQGDEEFFCAFIRDITQRKINEEKLTESEREYRELALQLQLQQIQLNNAQELAKIGSWETDLSNLDVSWSDETYRIFGTDRASYETTHESFLSFVHPDDKEKVNQAFIDSAQAPAGTQHRIEHRIVTVPGVIKVVEEQWKITFGDKGEPLLATGSCQDITERKKAEETILRANERFERVTEATNDAIWDWNIKDNVLYWGGGFKTLFGHDVEKTSPSHESWREHIHPEDLERVVNGFNKAIESDQTYWTDEYRFKKVDGSYAFVIDRGIVIKDSKSQPIQMVGAMTDISERMHHEVELLSINEKLNIQTKELQRSNEELEQFAFISSHDLQEPLRMISSFMELLEKKYSDRLDEKGRQYIYFANDGAKRMKQIILDLLVYSSANKSSQEQEVVDLNETLSDYRQSRKKVIFDKSVVIQSGQLPIMKTHRAPVTQVFHGILDNAIKYAKSDISPVIEIKVKEKRDAWEFSIKDNGIGIDDEFSEKIFGIFQRLHNREQYEGTGIGLAVAKRSVEFLGGTIWVTSKVGEGSTFHFTIKKQQTISEQYEK